MPHFKAFGMMNLQYLWKKEFDKKIIIQAQYQIQVAILLSGTDVKHFFLI